MFETLGFETLTAPQAAVGLGLILGLAFGALAEVTRFCLRRAVAGDAAERRLALGVWLAALAAARPGDLLYADGHVMMFLGCEDGEAWVIHDTSNTGGLDGRAGQVAGGSKGVLVTPLTPAPAPGGGARLCGWLLSGRSDLMAADVALLWPEGPADHAISVFLGERRVASSMGARTAEQLTPSLNAADIDLTPMLMHVARTSAALAVSRDQLPDVLGHVAPAGALASTPARDARSG